MPPTFLIFIGVIVGALLLACLGFCFLVRKLFKKETSDKIIEWFKVAGVVLAFGFVLKLGLES